MKCNECMYYWWEQHQPLKCHWRKLFPGEKKPCEWDTLFFKKKTHKCSNCAHYQEFASYCFIKEKLTYPTDVCTEWESRD